MKSSQSAARWLGAAVLAFAALAAGAQSVAWQQLPGAAYDIGVGGPNNTTWVIGTNGEGGGYGIYRWNPGINNWDKIPGSALRIDVDPQGNAWVVNNAHNIYRFDGRQFVQVPGAANDIGIGANGTVWVIGNDKPSPNDFSIYRYANNNWQKMPGWAVRIDVDPQGNAWVVNSTHNIFRWDGAKWVQLPGAALDVGVGADGSVFVVGTDQGVYKWNGSTWIKAEGGLTNISVDNKGLPYGVNSTAAIWAGHTPPTITRATLDQWINKYAPVVYFNQAEKYFPTSAEGFMSIVQPAGDGLALRDTSDRAKAGNLGLARVYVNAKVAASTTELQYWLLYAYNGPGTAYWKYFKAFDWKHPLDSGRYAAIGDYLMTPCGQHEGDWEHITVRVDNNTGNLVAGYLAQHDGGAWFPANQVNMAGGRVTFYASKFGHAAYWGAARDYSHFVSIGIIEFRLLNDTEHAAQKWDTRANGGPLLMAVQGAPAIAVAPQQWMQYKGRWGRVYERGVAAARTSLESEFGSVGGTLASLGTVQLADIIMDKAGLKGECEQEAGPAPPWSKGSWTGVDD